jgi:hypothetical protein
MATAFAIYERPKRDEADDEHNRVHLTELPDKQECVVVKIMATTGHAKEACRRQQSICRYAGERFAQHLRPAGN